MQARVARLSPALYSRKSSAHCRMLTAIHRAPFFELAFCNEPVLINLALSLPF